MPRFEVGLQFEYEITVEAENESEAIDIAYEDFDSGDLVWDDVQFVRELKGED